MSRSIFLWAILAATGLAVDAQVPETRTARLTPSPIEAATSFELTGGGSATATLTGTTLTVDGTFDGLQEAATTASLHAEARGLRGPMVASLELNGSTGGTIRAEVKLSDVQAGYFRDQRLYIQLQSETHPEGLLRGWLVQPED